MSRKPSEKRDDLLHVNNADDIINLKAKFIVSNGVS